MAAPARRSRCCTGWPTTPSPLSASREFAAALGRVGWPVELVELDADHGSIAGADYDPVADRYGPGTSEEALRVAGEVATRISALIGH